MLKIESKIGTVNRNISELYSLLTNFELLASIVPKDEIQEFEVKEDRFSFVVQGQKTEIVIADKEENNFVKYANGEISPAKFFFWIQMKEKEPYVTKIKLTLHLDVPLLLQPFIKGKIEKGLNEIVDKLSLL